MAYAIMRAVKLPTAGNISASLAHSNRERPCPNADPEKTKNNQCVVRGDLEKLKEMTEGRFSRKDNVQCIEFVLTASPEFFKTKSGKEKADFYNAANQWVESEFGKKNVLNSVLHLDESTPHLHIHVVPIDEKGKLNAKKWLGGRVKLRQLQDRFYEAVKDFGLERGVERSHTKHIDLQTFYGAVEKSKENDITVPDIKMLETSRGYSERVKVSIDEQTSKLRAKAAFLDVNKGRIRNAVSVEKLSKQLKEVSAELTDVKKEYAKLQKAYSERQEDIATLRTKYQELKKRLEPEKSHGLSR